MSTTRTATQESATRCAPTTQRDSAACGVHNRVAIPPACSAARALSASSSAWALPRMHPDHAWTWHRVIAVVSGGLVLACQGRVAYTDVAAFVSAPPVAERCTACSPRPTAQPLPQPRVSLSFDLSDVVELQVAEIAVPDERPFDRSEPWIDLGGEA